MEDLGVAEASENVKKALDGQGQAKSGGIRRLQTVRVERRARKLEGRYESLNEKYALEREAWVQEKREMDASGRNCK